MFTGSTLMFRTDVLRNMISHGFTVLRDVDGRGPDVAGSVMKGAVVMRNGQNKFPSVCVTFGFHCARSRQSVSRSESGFYVGVNVVRAAVGIAQQLGAAASIALLPVTGTWKWAWIPLLLDCGGLPMLLRAAIERHRKK